jgi:hypothetical protein
MKARMSCTNAVEQKATCCRHLERNKNQQMASHHSVEGRIANPRRVSECQTDLCFTHVRKIEGGRAYSYFGPSLHPLLVLASNPSRTELIECFPHRLHLITLFWCQVSS